MLTFNVSGEGGIHLKYQLLDAATKLPACVLAPPTDKYMHFYAGDDTLLPGATITGGTSSATARIVAQEVTSGAMAGTGVGIIFLDHITGTFVTTEDLNVGGSKKGSAGSAVITTFKDQHPTSIFFSVEANTIRYCYDGTIPLNTDAGYPSLGHPAAKDKDYAIAGWSNVQNFYMINADDSADAIVDITVQF